jgi:hypothetical protein
VAKNNAAQLRVVAFCGVYMCMYIARGGVEARTNSSEADRMQNIYDGGATSLRTTERWVDNTYVWRRDNKKYNSTIIIKKALSARVKNKRSESLAQPKYLLL